MTDATSARDEPAHEDPSPVPRPEAEYRELLRIWKPPKGWRILSEVNNTFIGTIYVGAGFLFFSLAGLLAVFMRTQLAVPENTLIGHALYNQMFTMHGSVMMFVFAVPMMAAFAVLLLPNILGARELPFPRLSAFGLWVYVIGGLAFFSSLFFGLAPDGGWFMYPPLTDSRYSPGLNADFWLLGIAFIEIAALGSAVEIIVGFFRSRAIGMSLNKIPIFAWVFLVFALMIVFAFPALILGTVMLELERALDWPFFEAERGGDPLLWQHLFWFFGHPEVYIIFLPAAGLVSQMLPTMAQTPLAGYRLVILAVIATGLVSFGLWVHHMYATGLPQLSLSFFSAASMVVAIPSGIQVFAWIATIANGRLRLVTPALFILGFLFIFTLGGLTGVMVAIVPFDWQVHDTYFIVAHFHYVLVGGMVFPLFAALYYWIPTVSRRPLSERLGKWVFWLFFLGMNITFFTMHITGLMGMPRRVYTYLEYMDWGLLNLISTVGTYMMAVAVALFVLDVFRNFRFTFSDTPGNVWNAGSFEWVRQGTYGFRSFPGAVSREPLWTDPTMREGAEEGRYFMPGPITGKREQLITGPIDATPQFIMQVPGPHWGPLLAAIFTAGFFLLLIFKMPTAAIASGAVAVVFFVWWIWELDPGHTRPPAHIGGGIVLPVYAAGSVNQSWWGVVVLILILGTIFVCHAFSYFFLWLVNPSAWPPAGVVLPSLAWPIVAGGLYAASSIALLLASRALARTAHAGHWPVRLLMFGAAVLLVSAAGVQTFAEWQTGLRPTHHSYGASVYLFAALQGGLAGLLVLMTAFTLARSLCGMLDATRRVTFDNTMLLWHYTVAQGIVALTIVSLFPRALG